MSLHLGGPGVNGITLTHDEHNMISLDLGTLVICEVSSRGISIDSPILTVTMHGFRLLGYVWIFEYLVPTYWLLDAVVLT